MSGSRRMSLMPLATAIALSMLCKAEASDPTPKGWSTYVNTKYDFDICTPASLHAQPPAPAGDGQVFTGPGGGTLTVFWRPGTDGDTLAKTVQGEVTAMGAAPVISYSAGRAGWAVRSGHQGAGVFYVKVLQRDSDYLIMDVKYPAASATSWNELVGHFAACFESSRPKG